MAVTVMLGIISETVMVMVRGGSVVVEMNEETRVVKVVTAWVGMVRVSTDEVLGTAKEVVTYGSAPGWVVSWHSRPMKPMFVENGPAHRGVEGLAVEG